MSDFVIKSKIWKAISDNIKKEYNIRLFKMDVFGDGSGTIWELKDNYTKLTQVFQFDNVEDVITRFLVL